MSFRRCAFFSEQRKSTRAVPRGRSKFLWISTHWVWVNFKLLSDFTLPPPPLPPSPPPPLNNLCGQDESSQRIRRFCGSRWAFIHSHVHLTQPVLGGKRRDASRHGVRRRPALPGSRSKSNIKMVLSISAASFHSENASRDSLLSLHPRDRPGGWVRAHSPYFAPEDNQDPGRCGGPSRRPVSSSLPGHRSPFTEHRLEPPVVLGTQ